jgi:uncharacterized protein DUF4255
VILDLSAVTDFLTNLVRTQWATAPIWAELGLGAPPFTPTISGLAPDAIRDADGPQLSMFLYHVESDNAQESAWWAPEMVRSPGQPVRYLPFALDLYYLLSAYSKASYAEEQQAMSVAVRIYHANAVVRSGPPDPTDPLAWQLTLTMEHRSYDELSRLWQATTVPLRLGVVYRAAVLFLTPDEPGVAAKNVDEVDLRVKANIGVSLAGADLVKVTLP